MLDTEINSIKIPKQTYLRKLVRKSSFAKVILPLYSGRCWVAVKPQKWLDNQKHCRCIRKIAGLLGCYFLKLVQMIIDSIDRRFNNYRQLQ